MKEKLIELVKDALQECRSITDCGRCKGYNKGRWCQCVLIADRLIANGVTVREAVFDDMREFARDVAIQFGYYCKHKGRLHISHGGLSTLEWAFNILGWEEPHPVPECECEIDGCYEHATCGTPTDDGYKFVCHKHFRERGV